MHHVTLSSVIRPMGFMPREITSLVNCEVVDAHVGEAAFLWVRRQAAAEAAHYKLHHLAKVDARVSAHLAGLRVAGVAGCAAARAALGEGSAGALFVVTWLGAVHGDTKALRNALQLGLSSPTFGNEVAAGVGWLDASYALPLLRRFADSSEPGLRYLGLDGEVVHEIVDATHLRLATQDDSPAVRARAICGIGESGRRELAPVARSALGDADAACRFWAAWTCALLGDASAAPAALDIALDFPAYLEPGLQVAMRCGEIQWARDAVRSLAAQPATRRTAIRAAGALGDPATLPWLLAFLDEPLHARVAGEAIASITGADLAYLDLDRDSPDDDEPLDADADLPYPDASALNDWWRDVKPRYVSGHRYLGGGPAALTTALTVLRSGYQRQRAGAAIEFAAQSPGTWLFPVRARVDRQNRRLAA